MDLMDDENSQRPTPLTPDFLKSICHDPALKFLNFSIHTHGFTSDQPRLVFSSVLGTAQNEEIPVLHQIQACSAVFALIEHFQKSSSSELQAMVSPESLWDPILSLFLDRSKNMKAKTLKRLLAIILSMVPTNYDENRLSKFVHSLSLKIIDVLRINESVSSLKRALQALEFFMKKCVLHPLDVSKLASTYSKTPKIKPSQSLDDDYNAFRSFALELFQFLTISEVAPVAGGAIKAFFASAVKMTATNDDDLQDRFSWGPILLESIHRNLDDLEAFKNHVYPGLFEIGHHDLLIFLDRIHFRQLQSSFVKSSLSEQEMIILCSALEVAKILGKLKEASYTDVDERSYDGVEKHSRISLDDDVIRRLTKHHSADIRCSALSLLISSPSSTTPLTQPALTTFVTALPYYCNEIESKTRNIFLAFTLKLLDRVRAATFNLQNKIDSQQKRRDLNSLRNTDHIRDSEIIEYHHRFVLDCFNIIKSNLHPLSTYQTTLASLKSFEMFLHSGIDPTTKSHKRRTNVTGNSTSWSFRISIFDKGTLRNLLDLLFSPFDDIRALASMLLKGYNLDGLSAEKESSPFLNTLLSLEKRSETKAEISGRSDHADGQAQLYKLKAIYGIRIPRIQKSIPSIAPLEHVLCRLEEKLSIAKQDLLKAVASMPVHGELIGARYLRDFLCNASDTFSEPEGTQIKSVVVDGHVFQICQLIWDLVEPILCDDSPEGLDKLNTIDAQQDVGTKELLSFCWRALKEASLLLRRIIESPFGDIAALDQALREKVIRQISQLSFTQLSSLRHRGAITTVAGTFQACCKVLHKSPDLESQRLFESCYIDTVELIHGKSTIVTRRSAGIPFLMIGILSADMDSLFHQRAFTDLMIEAQLQAPQSVGNDENKLPQVHALNCLKDLFMCASIPSKIYITSALEIAATSISSQIWAIRNCGLMLFSALIDRICGMKTPQSVRPGLGTYKIMERESYLEFPGLSSVVFNLLKEPEQGLKGRYTTTKLVNTAEVEKVLLALEILCRAGLPHDNQKIILMLVRSHLKSSIWHIRTLAAKAYAFSTFKLKWPTEILEILEIRGLSYNEMHGRLLCALSIVDFNLQESFKNHQGIDLISLTAATLRNQFIYCRSCPFILAVFLDIINTISRTLLLYGKENLIGDFKREHTKYLKSLVIELDPKCSRRDQSLYGISFGSAQLLLGWLERDVSYLKQVILLDSIGNVDTIKALLSELVEIATSLKGLSQIQDYTNFISEIIILLLRMASEIKDIPESVIECVADLLQLDYRITEALAFRKTDGIVEVDPSLKWDSTHTAPPSYSSALLRWTGSIIAINHLLEFQYSSNLSRDIHIWIHLLHQAGEEKNSFDIRSAAIQSLFAARALLVLRRQDASIRHELLGAYLILYDCLNDDDEEIREKAAELVSYITDDQSSHRITFAEVPLAAATTLISWLTSHALLPELCEHAIARLTNAIPDIFLKVAVKSTCQNPANRLVAFRPPAETLMEAMNEDHALFVEEKQNLYISHVREVDTWTKIALEMSKPQMSPALVDAFLIWVKSSLRLLIQTAEERLDGPLGWTSNPDVFCFGIRVIGCAEVLLGWSRVKSITLVELQPMKDMLRKLIEQSEQGRAHELWASKISKVLD